MGCWIAIVQIKQVEFVHFTGVLVQEQAYYSTHLKISTVYYIKYVVHCATYIGTCPQYETIPDIRRE